MSVMTRGPRGPAGTTGTLLAAAVGAGLALLAGPGAGVPAADAGAVLFEQLPDDSVNLNTYFGDTGNGLQIADNFTLASGALVTGLQWWGSPINVPVLDPELSYVTGFDVEIYADGGPDVVGANLVSEFFPTAATTPTATGNANPRGHSEFLHTIEFSSPVALAGGVQYWFSIFSYLTIPGNYGLRHSNDGDREFAIEGLLPEGWLLLPDRDADVSIRLVGVVPSPGAAALLGLTGLAACQRRRRP